MKRVASHATVADKVQKIIDYSEIELTRLSVVPPEPKITTEFSDFQQNDGSTKTIGLQKSTGAFGFDITNMEKKMAIQKWRQISFYPEVDDAVEEIANEVIISTEENPNVVKLGYFDNDLFSDNLKEKLVEEFDHILKILEFREKGKFHFKSFYVDAELPFEMVFDPNYIGRGILKLNKLDPKYLMHIKEYNPSEETGENELTTEYYRYEIQQLTYGQPLKPTDQDYSFVNAFGTNAVIAQVMEIPKELICLVDSGFYHDSKGYAMSNLAKAVKVANQLMLIEDAITVYRIVRAPERRAVYVDVGSMNSEQAMQEVTELANQNKLEDSYDPTSGEWTSKNRYLSLYEDIYLMRRGSASTTEIQSLSGAANLGEIGDLEYFSKKIWSALNVPWYRRMAAKGQSAPGTGFQFGKEVSIEELKFQKFKKQLRVRFGMVFKKLLKTQLLVKDIVLAKDIDDVISNLDILYNDENYFDRMLKISVLDTQVEFAKKIYGDNLSEFFSKPYIAKNIFGFTEDDIKTMSEERLHPEKYGFDVVDKFGAPAAGEDQFGGGGMGGMGGGALDMGGGMGAPMGGDMGMPGATEPGMEGMPGGMGAEGGMPGGEGLDTGMAMPGAAPTAESTAPEGPTMNDMFGIPKAEEEKPEETNK